MQFTSKCAIIISIGGLIHEKTLFRNFYELFRLRHDNFLGCSRDRPRLLFTKKSADVLYNKLHLNIFVPDSGASRRQADSDISGIRETDIVSMRNRTGSLYSLFVNLTGIFPLLGILGTVISLLGMVGDMTNVQDNFYGALTSTFWGLVFAIIFKFLDGIISAKIEDNEKNVQLYLERNNAEHSQSGEQP